jgi:hypothetical protein
MPTWVEEVNPQSLRRDLAKTNPTVESGLETVRVAKEHLVMALGRYFCFAKSKMYPQKYPLIPSVGCAIENGDF